MTLLEPVFALNFVFTWVIPIACVCDCVASKTQPIRELKDQICFLMLCAWCCFVAIMSLHCMSGLVFAFYAAISLCQWQAGKRGLIVINLVQQRVNTPSTRALNLLLDPEGSARFILFQRPCLYISFLSISFLLVKSKNAPALIVR